MSAGKILLLTIGFSVLILSGCCSNKIDNCLEPIVIKTYTGSTMTVYQDVCKDKTDDEEFLDSMGE